MVEKKKPSVKGNNKFVKRIETQVKNTNFFFIMVTMVCMSNKHVCNKEKLFS